MRDPSASRRPLGVDDAAAALRSLHTALVDHGLCAIIATLHQAPRAHAFAIEAIHRHIECARKALDLPDDADRPRQITALVLECTEKLGTNPEPDELVGALRKPLHAHTRDELHQAMQYTTRCCAIDDVPAQSLIGRLTAQAEINCEEHIALLDGVSAGATTRHADLVKGLLYLARLASEIPNPEDCAPALEDIDLLCPSARLPHAPRVGGPDRNDAQHTVHAIEALVTHTIEEWLRTVAHYQRKEPFAEMRHRATTSTLLTQLLQVREMLEHEDATWVQHVQWFCAQACASSRFNPDAAATRRHALAHAIHDATAAPRRDARARSVARVEKTLHLAGARLQQRVLDRAHGATGPLGAAWQRETDPLHQTLDRLRLLCWTQEGSTEENVLWSAIEQTLEAERTVMH